ncbi:MAG TPA: polysaccharide biosynthesis/export family protein [Terriglobales bacterium]|nr:polysaccharide biosynthesis/export family protein [Terriglobales bacterium]
MITKSCTLWTERIGILLLCAVLPTCLAAQTAAGNGTAQGNAPAKVDATSHASDASGKAHDDTFVIGNDDVLAINVWNEKEISRSVPVRSDGRISLPLVGEVQATGRTPLKLEEEITAKLKSFIAEPEVTVIVQQINSQKFNILGMVNKPGSYLISNSATILDAIALAGGFRDFAKQKNVYVLRQNPDGTQARLLFNYKDVVKGKNAEQNVKLQPRDTIVVP